MPEVQLASANALGMAQRRATARVFEIACLDGGWELDGHVQWAPATWEALGQVKRDAFCSAEKRIPRGLLDRLFVECPEAVAVWHSPIWDCLAGDATPEYLERRLRTLVRLGEQDKSLRQFLDRLASDPVTGGPVTMERVAALICATRLARSHRWAEAAGALAMRLSRSLLLLSVHWLYAPLSEEVWNYCGTTFVRGIRLGDAKVEFRPEGWAFANMLVREMSARISSGMLPRTPPRQLSVNALTEATVDCLVGLTSTSYGDAEYVLSQVPRMRALGGKSQGAVPSLDKVGILRPRE